MQEMWSVTKKCIKVQNIALTSTNNSSNNGVLTFACYILMRQCNKTYVVALVIHYKAMLFNETVYLASILLHRGLFTLC